ncbi:MAG: Hsp20/alpha crystallin family protein [Chloroflexi bacterium]|nr:Hsp20/alpha crystallin family protein [Chloroflexota bacterium]
MNTKDLVRRTGDVSSNSLYRTSGSPEGNESFPSLYREMTNWMQDWDNLLGDVFGPRWNWPGKAGTSVLPFVQATNTAIFNPAIDIREGNNEYTVTAELPGINPDDVEIYLQEGTLVLKGEKKFERENREEGYHRMERSYGSFRRAIRLPDNVDAERIDASFNNGLLTLTLPKLPEVKPETRRIPVKSQPTSTAQQAQLAQGPNQENQNGTTSKKK